MRRQPGRADHSPLSTCPRHPTLRRAEERGRAQFILAEKQGQIPWGGIQTWTRRLAGWVVAVPTAVSQHQRVKTTKAQAGLQVGEGAHNRT